MSDPNKAFERGLKGRDQVSWGDVFNPFWNGPSKEEKAAYQRGRETKLRMDEADRRAAARRSRRRR